MRQLTERIEGLAVAIVDEVIERGACDLVSDLAAEMPSYLIADLMGLPLEDGRELYKLTEILHSSGDTVTTEQRRKAQTDMFTYAAEVNGKKSIEPGEDLSTRNLVSGGMLELLRHDDQLTALRSDPDALRRTAKEATTIGDQQIAAGDKVVMYYGAANRDASVFADPNRFDIRRPNADEHIALVAAAHISALVPTSLGWRSTRSFVRCLRDSPTWKSLERRRTSVPTLSLARPRCRCGSRPAVALKSPLDHSLS